MKSILLSVSRYGVLMGLGFCLYTTIMWLTKLDTEFLEIGQYFDIAIIILPILMINLAIKKANNVVRLNVGKRIVLSIWVGLISFAIYQPFLYLYHNSINPSWFDAVLELKKSEMIASHFSSNEITQTLKNMQEQNLKSNRLFSLAAFVPSVFIIPILLSIISLIFIRKKDL